VNSQILHHCGFSAVGLPEFILVLGYGSLHLLSSVKKALMTVRVFTNLITWINALFSAPYISIFSECLMNSHRRFAYIRILDFIYNFLSTLGFQVTG
ncbi:hypothetical protein STEG23_013478, partial [Scotinomys teguina]